MTLLLTPPPQVSLFKRTVTYLTTVLDETDQTTYSGGSWSGISVPNPSADRFLIAGIYGSGNALRAVSAFTAGGNAMTLVANQDGGNSHSAIYLIHFPTGTSVNLSLTWDNTQLRSGVSLWSARLPQRLQPYPSGKSYDTDGHASISASLSLDSYNHGFVVAVGGNNNASSPALSNLTTDHMAAFTGSTVLGSGHASTSGSTITPGVNWGGSNAQRSFVAASF